MGEVIAFADVVFRRRRQAARQLHARCLEILAASIVGMREELAGAPPSEWSIRMRRLRKLEDLAEYAAAAG